MRNAEEDGGKSRRLSDDNAWGEKGSINNLNDLRVMPFCDSLALHNVCRLRRKNKDRRSLVNCTTYPLHHLRHRAEISVPRENGQRVYDGCALCVTSLYVADKGISADFIGCSHVPVNLGCGNSLMWRRCEENRLGTMRAVE